MRSRFGAAMEQESVADVDLLTNLPAGWRVLSLEDALSIQYGKSLVSSERDDSGLYRVYGSSGVVGHHTTYLTSDPVVVLGRKGAVGSVYLSADPCWPIDTVYFVRPRGAVDLQFIYYYLQHLDLGRLDRSTAIPGLSRNDVYAQTMPVPSLPEQLRIVEVIEAQFSRLDAAVAALKRAQANLGRYKASVLQAACEGRLVPTEAELARQEGRDYEPADVLLQRILAERRRKWEEARWAELVIGAKQKVAQARRKAAGRPARMSDLVEAESQDVPEAEYTAYLPKNDRWKAKYVEPAQPDTEGLPELPEGWVWTTVEQLGQVIGGLTKNQKRTGYPVQLPYLRVANVYADELRLNDVETIGLEESELSRALLLEGDLLVVEGNGSADQIGRVAVWDGSIDPCAHQNHVIKVRLTLPDMGRTVLWWLLSPDGRRQIVRAASSTSGLYTMSLSKVSQLLVPLAPLPEQRRMAEEIDRRISMQAVMYAAIDTNLTRIGRLRQSILKRAFEGRLVPQDPNDERGATALICPRRTDRDPSSDMIAIHQHRLPGMETKECSK